MATITTRSGKGSPLTNTEVDDNFTNLNTAKYESGNNVTLGTVTSGATTITGTTTITADTGDGLVINHGDFHSGLLIKRTHATNSPSIQWQNNTGRLGMLYAQNADKNIYWRPGTTTSNFKIWHAGNDGSGSGLDADTLDGINSGSFFNVGGKMKRWRPADQGNLTTYPVYYKVATVNKGNGGLHMRGSLNNHVEAFGTSFFDLNFFGREGNAGTDLCIEGTVGVSTAGTGVLVVKSSNEGSYHTYDVYIALARYSMVSVDLTQEGNTEIFTPDTGTTTKPTGYGTEFDTTATAAGYYVIQNSVGTPIWHSGNDGSGSGLHADLLDGLHASSFLRSNEDDIATHQLTLRKDDGPLYIQSATNAPSNGAMIKFSDNFNGFADGDEQYGWIKYKHADGQVGYEPSTSNDGFIIGGSENNTLVNIHGQLNVTDSANIDGNLFVDGHLYNEGLLTVSGKRVLYLPSNSSERGPWNPIVTAIRGSGTRIHQDEDFATGVNNVSVYNNEGGTAVTHHYEDDSTTLGKAAPNSSGKVIRIQYTVGATSPNFGGFHQTFSSAANQTIVQIFQALVPEGRKLTLHENAQGTNKTTYWLTDDAGTGKWEWYARVSHCGPTGSFSTSGHVACKDGDDEDFAWYLASCASYRVTHAPNRFASWTDGNDGSGSGLDADTVDGVQAASFIRSDADDTISGNLETTGQITLKASSPQIKFEDTGDGDDQADDFWLHANSNRFYILADRADDNGWETPYPLELNSATNESLTFGNTIWTNANDGSGSGLDADTLDGIGSGSFLRSDANDTKTGSFDQTSGSFISSGFTTTNLNSAWQVAGTTKNVGIAPFRYQDDATNKPEGGNNAHWGLNIYAHAGSGGAYPYGHQISAASSGTIWNRWVSSGSFSGWKKIWDSGNDGSGSGLDADTIDGVQASGFLQPDANGKVVLTEANGTANERQCLLVLKGETSNRPYIQFSENTNEGITSGMSLEYNGYPTGVSNYMAINGVTGDLRHKFTSGGNYTATGNVTAYSDARLKDNIETLDGSKVYEMRGVSFTKDGKANSGVIAQELQKVAPELVHDDGEYLSVAYGNTIGYLIEAIKDLKAEIDELKGAKNDAS